MAFKLPALPKVSGRVLMVLAAVGALGLGAVAANASKHRAANQAGAAAPKAADKAAGKTANKATDQSGSHDATAAELKAAAALPQCRSARLVPVNRSWGIPLPTLLDSASTNCNLMYGDKPYRGSNRSGDPDTAIRVLQRNLNFCYGTKLAVDGIYGSNTRAAIKTVQRRHNLTVDGIYGPKTRSAMNWRLYSMGTRTWSRSCSSPL